MSIDDSQSWCKIAESNDSKVFVFQDPTVILSGETGMELPPYDKYVIQDMSHLLESGIDPGALQQGIESYSEATKRVYAAIHGDTLYEPMLKNCGVRVTLKTPFHHSGVTGLISRFQPGPKLTGIVFNTLGIFERDTQSLIDEEEKNMLLGVMNDMSKIMKLKHAYAILQARLQSIPVPIRLDPDNVKLRYLPEKGMFVFVITDVHQSILHAYIKQGL
jgi:hypothetical protein